MFHPYEAMECYAVYSERVTEFSLIKKLLGPLDSDMKDSLARATLLLSFT
jgi:hypothetical protein